MFNLVDFVDRLVDSVDFNKIDRVEVDFVTSVYEALEILCDESHFFRTPLLFRPKFMWCFLLECMVRDVGVFRERTPQAN